MVKAEYKHLKPDEKAIAERFVKAGLLPGSYEYDVALESPDVRFPAHWTKADFEHWSGLRAKRIDVVVTQTDTIWVLEVTPKLSKTSVGGCLTYKEMYIKQFSPVQKVRMGIVVEVDDLAYHGVLQQHDIALWVV